MAACVAGCPDDERPPFTMTILSDVRTDSHFSNGVQKPTRALPTPSSVVQIEDATSTYAIPSHPLGLRPLGNAYLSKRNLKNAAGNFAALPDELLVQLLEVFDAQTLFCMGSTCKALYAFSRTEDLWKSLCIESSKIPSPWRGTWYATYRGIKREGLSRISCNYLFSDVLHRPFLCAHTPLSPYRNNIPQSNAIPKLANLSLAEFTSHWTDRPFILTEPVKQWPLYSRWSVSDLVQKYGEVGFRAEAVDWPLKTYVHYMQNNEDESPLYLFDRSFIEKMSLNTDLSKQKVDYAPPDCFGADLFSVLSSQRPDHRWLIIGPARSGSTFHKDPNATSAWNAVIRGSKYWIMFPSHPNSPPPPGVFVSEDQSEVTSPLSIAEWLLSFHAIARATPGCKEGVCAAGEVLHVPSGWWHLVVNLDASVAITQNFVPEKHLVNVLDFLKNKPEQVSGFSKEVKDPYDLFVRRMREQKPAVLQRAMEEMQRGENKTKKRKWETLACVDHDDNGSAKGEARGFSFGFGDGDDEEVP